MTGHLPYHLDNYSKLHNLDLTDQPYLESQIASISDDIAYNNHDVEDAIRANLISLDDIAELSFFEKIIINLKDHYKDIPNKLLVYQVLRNSISNMINDIYETTKKNLIENNINSIDDIRKKNNFVVSFSNEMKKNCDIIKKFLFDKVYNHSHLSDKRQYSKKVISTLFTYFVKNNNKLPVDWRNQNIEIERLICDYISGMTDRFALNLYKEISE